MRVDHRLLDHVPSGVEHGDLHPGAHPGVEGQHRLAAQWGAQQILPYGSKKPKLWPRTTVRMVAGPPVDLSAYQGKRLGASTLQAATADIMADITGLLGKIRQETPPAAPWDLAVGGRVPLDRTKDLPAPLPAASPGEQEPEGEARASS